MAVFQESSAFRLDPLLKEEFTAMLYNCHGRPVTEGGLRYVPGGGLADAQTGLFLRARDPVMFCEEETPLELETVDPAGKVRVRCEGRYLCAMRNGEMKMVGHKRAWETFRLDRLTLSGAPEHAVDPRVAALSVILAVKSVWRLRSAHGGLVTRERRCDGKESGEGDYLTFRTKKRLGADRFAVQVVDADAAKVFYPGSSIFLELRIGNGGVAKAAVRVATDGDSSGCYLRADPSGELTERVDEAEEWENFVVEATEQSVTAGLEDLDRIRASVREAQKRAAEGLPSGLPSGPRGRRDKPVQNGKRFDYTAALRGASGTDTNGAAAASSESTARDKHAAKPGPSRVAVAAVPKAADEARTQENGGGTGKTAGSRRSKKKQRSNKKTKPKSSPGTDQAGPSTQAAAAPESKGGDEKKAKDDVVHVNSLDDNEDNTGRPRDPCFACGRQLEGTFTKAMGRKFHPTCFQCATCRRPLTGGSFREDRGRALCDNCYKQHVAPRCANCGDGILGTVTTALNKTWHPACFLCRRCGCPITADKFYVLPHKPNEPFCGTCHAFKSNDGPKFSLARVNPIPGAGQHRPGF